MRRLAIPLLALAAVLFGARGAAGDDADLAPGRGGMREALLAEAQRALETDPARALESMRRSLAADIAFAEAYRPKDAADTATLEAFQKTIEERRLFLGDPAALPDATRARLIEDGKGAAWAAIRLDAWLRGTAPCEVILDDFEPLGANPKAYRFPPETPKDAPPAPDEPSKGEPSKGDAPKGDAPTKDEGAAPQAPKGDAPKAENGKDAKGAEPKGKDEPGKADEAKAKPVEAPKPKTPEQIATAWARDVRDAEGARFVDRRILPAPCGDLEALLAAADRTPAFIHERAGGLRRFALSRAGLFDYNLASSLLRAVQARERSLRMQADRPQPSLVDGSMVREKNAAVQVLQELAERTQGWRDDLVAELDAMALALDGWKTQAALVASDIESIREELGTTGKGAAEVAQDAVARESAHLPLRLAQAHESMATMEIGLLLSTASRAGYRLQLLERLERSASEELREAEQVRDRYEEALLRLRTARRIDRLERDRERLRVWAANTQGAQPGTREATRHAAYRALVALHEAVHDAVAQRRAMAVGSAREVSPDVEAARAKAKAAVEQADGAAAGGPRLSLPVAVPASATWDLKFIDLARRELLDPTLRERFDARLVAEHYAEASAEVNRLVRAERSVRRKDELRVGFDVARAKAVAALEPLESDVMTTIVRRLPALLKAASEDFDAAIEGVRDQQDRNRERLGALLAYQELLTRQGTRSLLIRVDRSRQDPFFGDVVRETRSALESAGKWASFQGEDHLGGWMKHHGLRLLLALLVIAVALVVSRFLRRVVDAHIDRTVERIPGVGASVREERERARRRRKRADEAARAITDDDVLQVPVEDLAATRAPVEADGASAEAAPSEDPKPKEGA